MEALACVKSVGVEHELYEELQNASLFFIHNMHMYTHAPLPTAKDINET